GRAALAGASAPARALAGPGRRRASLRARDRGDARALALARERPSARRARVRLPAGAVDGVDRSSGADRKPADLAPAGDPPADRRAVLPDPQAGPRAADRQRGRLRRATARARRARPELRWRRPAAKPGDRRARERAAAALRDRPER